MDDDPGVQRSAEKVLHQETLIQTDTAVCSPAAVTKTNVSFRRLECSHTPDDSHQTSWKRFPDRQTDRTTALHVTAIQRSPRSGRGHLRVLSFPSHVREISQDVSRVLVLHHISTCPG